MKAKGFLVGSSIFTPNFQKKLQAMPPFKLKTIQNEKKYPHDAYSPRDPGPPPNPLCGQVPRSHRPVRNRLGYYRPRDPYAARHTLCAISSLQCRARYEYQDEGEVMASGFASDRETTD
jgi:hypothetical protein